MKTVTFRRALVLSLPLLMTGLGGLALADQSGTNVADDKPDGSASAEVRALTLADELALYGIEQGDAMLVVQAARIKAGIDTRSLDVAADSSGGGEAGDDKDETLDLSVSALLDRAQVLAGGDEQVMAIVDEVRDSGTTRGRSGGAAAGNFRVLARSTDVFNNVYFDGGRTASVSIRGDGDTDLDLYVYDENGNEICASVSYSDRETCTWRPRWTGPFRIEVANLGGVWNGYRMVTN
ncbi:hypothetical protein [Sediminicurvatus halobius]|uniref:Peptidase C-terminal archaeal/bacterial domain-containing protein n=1 Tax=Sediminicurvatus halobius TaxID=2182432 RepID=A0A2U2N9M9_9GAMM|nr:hypothetical protein [Spiribacter halobius]PWG65808.1 hypothetical protein DEM34_00655 [Spiribacter halobius]UEX77850.1 hypothetical protein LMH63_18290 [Spiribacter halobius]